MAKKGAEMVNEDGNFALRRRLSVVAAAVVLGVAGMGAVGCGDDNDDSGLAEDAGQAIDEGVNDATDAADDAAEEVDKAAEDAGNKLEDAADDATDGSGDN